MTHAVKKKPAYINLPARESLTLEMVAARWGCSVENILHYGQTEKIRISQYFVSVRAIFKYFDEKITPPFQQYQSTFVNCPFGIASMDITKIVNGNLSFQPTILFSPGPILCKQGRFTSAEVIESDRVQAEGLIIIYEELTRFESDFYSDLDQEDFIESKEKTRTADWKIRAHEIANELTNDMKKEIKAIIIKKQLVQEEIYGRGGRAISHTTILREIL